MTSMSRFEYLSGGFDFCVSNRSFDGHDGPCLRMRHPIPVDHRSDLLFHDEDKDVESGSSFSYDPSYELALFPP